jgi:uroporphyrinogen III methyltransferase/synthase
MPVMMEPLAFLVGAGPGHPDLMTLRALECLRQADLVLHERLIAPEVLDRVPAMAERVCVADLAPQPSGEAQAVLAAMIAGARAGRRVVRLREGDSWLFGSGAKEAEALRRAGVPFEVVPGVTAGVGAAAFAGIPLTPAACGSAVAFIGAPNTDWSLDWAALARFPGTLVFQTRTAHLVEVASTLVAHGKPADTPAAVVWHATLGCQRTATVTLAEVPRADIEAPAVLIVGPVVRLRESCAWFERLSLFGRGVLVTRPRHQATGLMARLRELGAVPYLLPAVEVREPADWRPVDAALARLSGYQWLVFTSSNGVHALMERLLATGRDLRALGSVRLAAIGPTTAAALRTYRLMPDFMPASYNSETLAAGLISRAAGQRLLLARADRGRNVLRQELSAVATVDQVAVYAQVDAIESDPAILAALRRGDVHYVMLTSSNVARSFARAVDEAVHDRIRSGAVRLVTISAVTSADVRALGWPVAGEAQEATAEGVVRALVALAARENSSGDSAEVAERVPAQEQNQAAGEDAEHIDGGA